MHVNTLDGFWLLLRSRLRPHRGISQEKLPLHVGFFEPDRSAKWTKARVQNEEEQVHERADWVQRLVAAEREGNLEAAG